MSQTNEAGNPSPTADVNSKSTDELRSLLSDLSKTPSSLPAEVSTDTKAPTTNEAPPAKATEQVAETPTDPKPEATDAKAEPQPTLDNPEGKKDETVPETPKEDDVEELKKRRVRPRSDLDQQVIDLYKSEGFKGTFEDAVRTIYGTTKPAAKISESPNETEGSVPDPLKRFDDAATSVKAEIAELEKKVDAAAEALETSKALKLQQEIFRKEIALRSIETDKEAFLHNQRAQVANTLRSKAEESRDAVFAEFPVLKDAHSTERKQFDAFIAEKQADPDYADIFRSPRWPQLVAREFAATHSLKTAKVATPPANQTAPAKTTPAKPVPVATNTKVLTSADTASSKPQPISEEQLRADLRTMKKDDLFALLGAAGKRR